MRVGHADTRFSKAILTTSYLAIIFLGIWVFIEIPDTKWHWGNFIVIYLVAVIIYTNIGVWLHEQLHCLAFRGANITNRTHIKFSRKYIIFLNGHYIVKGPITYRIIRSALLAPIALSVGLSVVGWLGKLFLPDWWLPILLTMAVAGVIDMTHDFYMYLKIQEIGEKGKYWDRGHYLEVVWKE